MGIKAMPQRIKSNNFQIKLIVVATIVGVCCILYGIGGILEVWPKKD